MRGRPGGPRRSPFRCLWQVVGASGAPIQWDIVDNIRDKITPEATESLKRTGVGIKGQFITAIGRGSLPSINVQLRQALNLYANIVAAVSIPGGYLCIAVSTALGRLAARGLRRRPRRHALPPRERGHRHDP